MKIATITLKNFRSFTDFREQLSYVTEFSGKNGSGKTTIKEAILFCLYGRDNSGSLKANDSLITNGQVVAEVELETEDFDIKRVKNASASKVFQKDSGHRWESVAQRDLETVLPKHNLFQSIFDVGYFHTLAEKEQRQIIVENSPAVDRKVLFKELYPQDYQFLDRYGVDFKDGYGTIRQKLAVKIRNLNTQIATENKSIEFTYTADDIKRQRERVERLQGLLDAMGEQVCSKCGQPVKKAQDLTMELREEKMRLSTMKEVDEHQAKRKKAIATAVKGMRDKIMEMSILSEDFSPKKMPAVEFGIKVKPIIKFLDQLLPGIEIETSRYIKATHIWEEAFVIKYHGVPYERLSTGEQKKVALAFSEMLDKLTGYVVGIKFVDHMESVTGKLPEVGGQLILARVTDDILKVKKEKEVCLEQKS